ncbi:hypothetical protein OG799_06910 [Micromonospora sp. NBC_00898]|uniref:hypothetical protein n=1 Tax=Micromonospora sp. NBC_00898 TaxID=2975981 RepID=UPI00386BCE0F|nr:hypothetical protein OG799_06910 [Micromonospora sp. NBC_00898]
MELRPELCPPVVGPQRIAELCTAIETIAGLLERGESADAAIAGFNAETGHDYTADYFLTYWKSRNSRTSRSRPPDPHGRRSRTSPATS